MARSNQMYSHHPGLPCWDIESYREIRKELLETTSDLRIRMAKSKKIKIKDDATQEINTAKKLMAMARVSYFRIPFVRITKSEPSKQKTIDKKLSKFYHKKTKLR